MKMPLRYRVDFSPDNEKDHYPAIGIFKKTPNSNRITGTFATETGDYRYLEGNFCDGKLLLSCFDGSHAFLFSADYDNGNLVNGVFKSGTHWTEPWVGSPDKDFELRHPDELTSIVDSSAIGKTRFYDDSGNLSTLADVDLDGKVTIIQILGTWCPNCMDETMSYTMFYEKFHSRGLEIIPIAFEGTDDPVKGKRILDEYKQDLGVPYPMYYGGKRGKSIASEAFPALNHIISYPTSIFIGRDGLVKKVHTGFYGPGTGIYYDNWLHDTEMLIESLLSQS
jgi:thiol-disulfide isomerase/thioredoxin